MVLIVFVVMIVNPGPRHLERREQWLRARAWIGPAFLGLILIAELIAVLSSLPATLPGATRIASEQVGAALFGPYLLGVELASLLLLAGLIGAYHLGRHAETGEPQRGQVVIEKSITTPQGAAGHGERGQRTSPQPESKVYVEMKEGKS